MRRGITEREVYRKLQVLERHSAFKQPYKFRSHPLAELNYEFAGYPSWPPIGGGGSGGIVIPPGPGGGGRTPWACTGGELGYLWS
jgi:hypothetical protein